MFGRAGFLVYIIIGLQQVALSNYFKSPFIDEHMNLCCEKAGILCDTAVSEVGKISSDDKLIATNLNKMPGHTSQSSGKIGLKILPDIDC